MIIEIIQLIKLFICKYFSNYIKDEIKKIENNIQQTPSQSELYLKEFKDLEENITLQLQDFIINMQCTLKFYYCNVMDYNVFANEKDELINLITNLIFKTALSGRPHRYKQGPSLSTPGQAGALPLRQWQPCGP